MSIAESGSRIRIQGDGDEAQTGPEVEFTDEICGETNQESCRAALSENENSGFRKQTSAMPHRWLMRHKCVQLSALRTLWRIGQVQEELIVSWYLKHRRAKTIRQLLTEVILHSWERSWRNGCNRNCMKVSYVIVFWSNQRMTIKGKVLELTEQGYPITIQ